jgi:toxin HigB-1
VARLKLEMLDAATRLEQLSAVPGNRFRKLKGDLKDYYRIWINDQYRLLFQ